MSAHVSFLASRAALLVVVTLAIGGCAGEVDVDVNTPSSQRTPGAGVNGESGSPSSARRGGSGRWGESGATTGPSLSQPGFQFEWMTAQERAWLQAVERLLPTMNKIFTDSPSEMTPSVLTSMARQLRGCRRELTRIGSATARLQPVQVLVEQACQEYDNGAKCFEAAARLGDIIGSAELRMSDQYIECGFAASGKGGEPLAEALIKVSEISPAPD